MGLKTTRPGGIIRKEDVSIAKNYLDGEELDTLNRIVNAYIEFAELRALQRKVMTMRDWITRGRFPPSRRRPRRSWSMRSIGRCWMPRRARWTWNSRRRRRD